MDNTNNSETSTAKTQVTSSEQKVEQIQPETQEAKTSPALQNEQNKQEQIIGSEPASLASQVTNTEAKKSELVRPEQQSSTSESRQQENSKGLEDILGKIQQGLKQRQFQGKLLLSITVGKTSVFKAIPGQKPSTNKITPEQITLLQQALKNPQGVQGAIRISVGSETVFHVRNGELKVDKLGLGQGQSQAQEFDQKAKKEAPAQTQQAQPQSGQAVAPSLETEIASLRLLVFEQQQQLNQMNQKLDRLLSSPPVAIVGSDQLKNWFSNLHSKIQTAGQQAVTHASNQLEQNKTTLRSKVQQMWSGVKETVTDKIHAASNAVQTKAGEIALGVMSAATTGLASALGEKLPDGSVVIENRNLNQRLEVNGNSVALKQRPQQDAHELWHKYSQGISSDRPVQRTLAVAQNALRDGMTKAGVEDLLKADPQFQKLRQEQGSNQAENYVKQMTRSAVRREQPTQEKPQQQLSRTQTQNQGLQR